MRSVIASCWLTLRATLYSSRMRRLCGSALTADTSFSATQLPRYAPFVSIPRLTSRFRLRIIDNSFRFLKKRSQKLLIKNSRRFSDGCFLCRKSFQREERRLFGVDKSGIKNRQSAVFLLNEQPYLGAAEDNALRAFGFKLLYRLNKLCAGFL